MVQLQRCYLLLFFTLSFFLPLTGTRSYFVKPFKNNSSCRVEPCRTINEYQRDYVFFSSTSFIFLDGRHELDTNFTMTDLVNVSLRADSNASVSIDCGGQTRFLFNNVSGLVIENIAFISCGISSVTEPLPGISLHNLDQAELVNITITNSSSGALYIQGSNVTIMNILIHKNRVNVNGTFSGMMVENSVLVFHGANTISQNYPSSHVDIETTCRLYYSEYYYDFFYETDTTESVFLAINTELIADGTLTVTNNTSPSGIMIFENSSIEMNGEAQFTGNSVCVSGALFLYGTKAILSGEVSFSSNLGSHQIFNAVAGMRILESALDINGGMAHRNNFATISSILAHSSNISLNGFMAFGANYGIIYTGILLSSYSSVMINGSTEIKHNSAYGGAIRIENSYLTITGKVLFESNTESSPCVAINSFVQFVGVVLFSSNSGILYSMFSEVFLEGNTTFVENNVPDTYLGGGIIALSSSLVLRGEFLFRDNQILSVDGGAIYVCNSSLILEGKGTFLNNSARHGGALYFIFNPIVTIAPGAVINFESNSAERGGAIYVVDDVSYIYCTTDVTLSFLSLPPMCFIDFGSYADNATLLKFQNNTATDGGSVLHGGMLDECVLPNIIEPHTALDIFKHVSDFENSSEPAISSDPFWLCYCSNNCSLSYMSLTGIARGQEFTVNITALSQVNNSVQSTVRSYLKSRPQNSTNSLNGTLQLLESSCTTLHYRVFSTSRAEELIIFADSPCRDIGKGTLTLRVSFVDCPVGFYLHSDRCECDKKIKKYTNSCNIDTGRITKDGEVNFWIGTENVNSSTSLILYETCPHDYCIEPPVDFDPSKPDSQCNNNRSGVLCGGCIGNFSLVLGSSRCMDCSDNSFLALLLVFAVLGILLVALLFLLQLTVARGTIHGLILYANIINLNKSAFIPADTFKVFTVFIAWLNLNFGIESCFYDGLDQIAKLWLNIAFPVYLWLLVGVIIVICHYSIMISKFFANSDPVAVLATVILLSYTKLIANLVAVLSIAQLQYPNNVNKIVMLYDGNVELFTSNTPAAWYVRISLSLVMLVVLYLPYTIILISAQFLQKISRVSYCCNKLRLTPFINAYHGPYKAASRYWIGMCLLLRCFVWLIIGATRVLSINLLVISSLSIGLASIIGIHGGIYSKRWLDVLEISFILNLGVFSAATYHIQFTGGNQTAAANISLSIVFITFVGIVARQSFQQLMRVPSFNRIMKAVELRVRERVQRALTSISQNKTVDGKRQNTVTTQELMVVSNVSCVLREPLLEDDI